MMNFILSYLLGSINFSWIIGKIFGIDISKKNDENLGATNLYHSLKEKYNKKMALFFAFIGGFLDLLKAYIPTILFGPLAGAFAVIGHCFSIFSIIITKKIPSGVGESTFIGFLLAMYEKIYIFFILYLVFISINITLTLKMVHKINFFNSGIVHILEIYSKSIALLIFFLIKAYDIESFILNSMIITILFISTARLIRFIKIYEKFTKK